MGFGNEIKVEIKTKKHKKKIKYKKNKKNYSFNIFLLNETISINMSYNKKKYDSYNCMITDKRGEVWLEITDGYIHRMYGLYTDIHPNNISYQFVKKIHSENVKRITKYNKYNWV